MPTAKKKRAMWGSLPKKRPAFVTRLREFRHRRGLTQAEVAERSGVSVAAVWAAERGADVSLTTAVKLAAFYDTPIERLWTGRAT